MAGEAMRKAVLEFLRKTGVRIPDEKPVKNLLKLSLLTEAQLEVLLVELGSASLPRRLSFEEKAGIRGVSKGAYARTLRQAVENIKRSIYTILLLRYLGVLGENAASRILEASDLLGEGRIEESVKLISGVMPRDITS